MAEKLVQCSGIKDIYCYILGCPHFEKHLEIEQCQIPKCSLKRVEVKCLPVEEGEENENKS